VGALTTERAFGSTALCYATVLPSVTRELSRWRARAEVIPIPSLRRRALAALRKRGNMQGAALLAVLAPRAARANAVRALVAFQAAYNYLDALAEQPSDDATSNARRLHEALLVALDPAATHRDYDASHPRDEDGGYLLGMVETTRACLRALPSYALVAPAARRAAARIVDFQSLNLGVHQGDHEGLRRWGLEHTPANSGLRWWETAAAAGSSLGVHVLIALAAERELDQDDVVGVEGAYFPWIGALHSLLDSTVDVAEDRRDGQRNLLGYYASTPLAAARLGSIAARAGHEARALARPHQGPRGRRHEMIVTAMASYYLSAPQASTPQARAIAASVTGAAGPLSRPALALFKAARLPSRAAHASMRGADVARAA
jgi:tetraprenyl-beta-curcumene synthase